MPRALIGLTLYVSSVVRIEFSPSHLCSVAALKLLFRFFVAILFFRCSTVSERRRHTSSGSATGMTRSSVNYLSTVISSERKSRDFYSTTRATESSMVFSMSVFVTDPVFIVTCFEHFLSFFLASNLLLGGSSA